MPTIAASTVRYATQVDAGVVDHRVVVDRSAARRRARPRRPPRRAADARKRLPDPRAAPPDRRREAVWPARSVKATLADRSGSPRSTTQTTQATSERVRGPEPRQRRPRRQASVAARNRARPRPPGPWRGASAAAPAPSRRPPRNPGRTRSVGGTRSQSVPSNCIVLVGLRSSMRAGRPVAGSSSLPDQPGATEAEAHEQQGDRGEQRSTSIDSVATVEVRSIRCQAHRSSVITAVPSTNSTVSVSPTSRSIALAIGVRRPSRAARRRRLERELRGVDDPERREQQPDRLAPGAGRELAPVVGLDDLAVRPRELGRRARRSGGSSGRTRRRRPARTCANVEHALRRRPAHAMDPQLHPGLGHDRSSVRRCAHPSAETAASKSSRRCGAAAGDLRATARVRSVAPQAARTSAQSELRIDRVPTISPNAPTTLRPPHRQRSSRRAPRR